jgi:hypothetical protein
MFNNINQREIKRWKMAVMLGVGEKHDFTVGICKPRCLVVARSIVSYRQQF